MTDLHGSCHCGALRLSFHTARPLDALAWRRCGCDFCRRHGGFYTSDPQGRLVVEVTEPGALRRYRFGQKTADFLICAHCGVFMAVTAEIDGHLHAVVNLAVIDPPLAPPADIPIMDFEGETVENRTARRKRNWIGCVHIRDSH